MTLRELLIKAAEGAYGDTDREVFVHITVMDGANYRRKRVPISSAFFGETMCAVFIEQEKIDAAQFSEPY